MSGQEKRDRHKKKRIGKESKEETGEVGSFTRAEVPEWQREPRGCVPVAAAQCDTGTGV